jgi:Spy/CpxP family protein refolding chaperone
MKQIIKIATLSIIMFFGVTSFAGNKAEKVNAEKRAELRMQRINKVCDLSDKQQQEIKQLFIEHKVYADNNQKQKLSKEERQALTNNRKNNLQMQQNALNNVLTPEQQTKWQAHKQAQKAKRPVTATKK